MTRTPIASGWYTFCLPSGQFGSFVLGPTPHVLTDQGRVDLRDIADGPLFLRPTLDGRRFVGKCWDEIGVVEFSFETREWLFIEQDACGNFSVIYDLAGLLHISDCKDGVNGWTNVIANDTPGGKLISGDSTYGPTPEAPKLSQHVNLSRDGDTLVIGQGHEVGGVLVWDGVNHRVLDTGACHAIYAIRDGDSCGIGYYKDLGPGRTEGVPITCTVAELLALPILEPPVPPQPIGPISKPLPQNTLIDLAPYFAIEDRCWPRGDKARGDTHGMDMERVPSLEANGDVVWAEKKFDTGDLLELMSMDAAPDGWIHLRADASGARREVKDGGPFVDTWTDTRWLRKTMRIGERLTIKCERVWYHPVSGAELGRENYTKRMSVLNVWERYYCGPDFGICRVLEYGYNVERYRVAIAADGRVAGWGDWDYNDGTSTAYSRFWLLGGQRFPVRLPNCPMPRAILEENPVPVPTPMPSSVVTWIHRYAMAYPPPWGPPGETQDQNCRTWTFRLAEFIRFVTGNPAWGAKSTGPGGASSKDVVAHDAGSQLNGYDVLTAAGGGSPVVPDVPGWIDITGQAFIPVSPVNHLDGSAVPTGRPALPFPWIGASSFDLGTRLSLGDRRWLDYLKAEDVRNPRVMPLRKVADSDTVAGCLARVPLLLGTLAEYQRKAEFVLFADTERHGMTEESALQWVRDCIARIEAQPNGIGAIQGANEPEHSTQQPFVRNKAFMAKVEALVPKRWPYTHGSSTNGGESDGASYLTTHGARNRTPYDNATVSVQLSKDTGLPVVKDEPIGVAEVAVPGSRTNDPDFGRQFADAIRNTALPGGTIHLQAGLTCNVDDLGPIQREAVKRFVKRMKDGTGEPPPPNGHPILDASMSPEYPVGYTFWVLNRAAVTSEIIAWYQRAHGRPPADSDIAHGLWRVINECDRWKTPRTALENTWPGGAPT